MYKTNQLSILGAYQSVSASLLNLVSLHMRYSFCSDIVSTIYMLNVEVVLLAIRGIVLQ